MRVVEDSQQDNNQHLPESVIGSSQTRERPNRCDASEILDERDSRFLIAWTGNNPDTDRPWTPSWVDTEECPEGLIEGWRKNSGKRSATSHSRGGTSNPIAPLPRTPKRKHRVGIVLSSSENSPTRKKSKLDETISISQELKDQEQKNTSGSEYSPSNGTGSTKSLSSQDHSQTPSYGFSIQIACQSAAKLGSYIHCSVESHTNNSDSLTDTVQIVHVPQSGQTSSPPPVSTYTRQRKPKNKVSVATDSTQLSDQHPIPSLRQDLGNLSPIPDTQFAPSSDRVDQYHPPEPQKSRSLSAGLSERTRSPSPQVKVNSWLLTDSILEEPPATVNSLTDTLPSPPKSAYSSGLSSPDQEMLGLDCHAFTTQVNQSLRNNLFTKNTTSEQYNLPIRLTAVQRSLYKRLIVEKKTEIFDFCKNPTDASHVESLISRLIDITIHPFMATTDMENGIGNMPMSELDQAWYLVQASSKFEFLFDLFAALQPRSLRVGVLVVGKAMMSILEKILRTLSFKYCHAGTSEILPGSGEGIVVVLIAEDKNITLSFPLDICIALDCRSAYSCAPLLRLVSKNTVEHILCDEEDPVTVISGAVTLIDKAGVCEKDAFQFIPKVVSFFDGNALELEQLSNASITSSQFEDRSYTASNASLSLKRRRADSDISTDKDSKAPKIIVTEIDGYEVHTEAPLTAKELLEDETTVLAAPAYPQNSTLSNIATINSTLDVIQARPNDTEAPAQFVSPATLQNILSPEVGEKIEVWSRSDVETDRVSVLEADLERMLDRFDKLRDQSRVLGEISDASRLNSERLERRLERLAVEAQVLRTERNDLRAQLNEARNLPIPDEMSIENLPIQIIQLKTELEKTKGFLANMTGDFEFVRQQYQQASSSAASLARECEKLTADITKLRNQTEDGQGLKLARLHGQAGRLAAEEQVKELQIRNDVLIEQLRRSRDAQEMRRGRERTRYKTSCF